MKRLNLNAIRIDGGTQPREQINMDAVADYAEAVKVGIEFPPVVVFHDGAEHWLADGFHRYHAHKQAGKASIEADVHAGSLLDAKLHAVGANGAHGLRRTNEDKRRAVQMVIDEPAWKEWSDRKIADACGVGHPFVAAIRRPAVAQQQQENRTKSPTQTPPKVESDSTPTPAPAAQKPIPAAEMPPEKLLEAEQAIGILSDENERLNDRLAVESMDASEEEKALAKETIEQLRALNKTLTVELNAVKATRDNLMRENGDLKKQVAMQRRQLDKAKA